MLTWALKKVLGTSHEREVKKLRPKVEAINALEPRISALTDAELAALQLTRDDVTTAWGQPIGYENDTDQVRHPDRPAPDNFPPYTARVVAQLPGRAEYQHLVIGAF